MTLREGNRTGLAALIPLPCSLSLSVLSHSLPKRVLGAKGSSPLHKERREGRKGGPCSLPWLLHAGLLLLPMRKSAKIHILLY